MNLIICNYSTSKTSTTFDIYVCIVWVLSTGLLIQFDTIIYLWYNYTSNYTYVYIYIYTIYDIDIYSKIKIEPTYIFKEGSILLFMSVTLLVDIEMQRRKSKEQKWINLF